MNRRGFLTAVAGAFVASQTPGQLVEAAKYVGYGRSVSWEEHSFDYGKVKGLSVTFIDATGTIYRRAVKYAVRSNLHPGINLKESLRARAKKELLEWVEEKMK